MAGDDFDNLVKGIHQISDCSCQGKTLEIGCGNGLFLDTLGSQCGNALFGIDNAEKMIELAKRSFGNRGIQFQTSEANSIPFQGIKFDLIIFHSVLQYFSGARYLERVIEECARRLSPQGKIIFLDVPDKSKKSHYLAALRKKNGAFLFVLVIFLFQKPRLKESPNRKGWTCPTFLITRQKIT